MAPATKYGGKIVECQPGTIATASGLAGSTGLRGFAINEFTGQRFYDLQVEARSLPTSLWVLRLGGVAFYDLGGASRSLNELELHQDAGVGLRMLIPQASAQLWMFDFAVPFDGTFT